MSVTQHEKAACFCKLHDGPGAFIIPNLWDVGSVSTRVRKVHNRSKIFKQQ
jgi:hypothetical protein